ncbi:hypothetical protein Pmani_030617 [Petrolisthes manimaculis]|uniref:Uncharacterized protein n=1 Tax=Petrolisthes manimaculis TaxID=1843537 RepID=A0AAE1TVR1_9EUCA|nr:hypothetical protein Pmani_030617 [Petrolisthes manimaculis]
MFGVVSSEDVWLVVRCVVGRKMWGKLASIPKRALRRIEEALDRSRVRGNFAGVLEEGLAAKVGEERIEEEGEGGERGRGLVAEVDEGNKKKNKVKDEDRIGWDWGDWDGEVE